MFSTLLYYLGFLPKIFQIFILIFCALVSIWTLKVQGGNLVQPAIGFLCYYAIIRFLRFLFGINNPTTLLWIILGIYLAFILYDRFYILGAFLFIIILSWALFFSNHNIIGFLSPILNIVLVLVLIYAISQFIDISSFRVIVYLIIAIPLLMFFNPETILEIVFLFEMLVRCFKDALFGLDGFILFLCMFILCFFGVYVIELAFAHIIISIVLIIVILYILNTIS